jgi:branched-subunit amino acid ABC-type transport system permease component
MSDTTRTWAALIAPFVSKAANAGEKGGIVAAVLGGLTATELAAFGGLGLAVLSYLTSQAMNFYFKWQHLKLAREKAAKEFYDE